MRACFTGISAVCLLVTAGAHAQLALQNGADIDMTGSEGSQIVFPDGTTLGSANAVDAVPGHGGTGNSLSGTDAFVGGGQSNTVIGNFAAISGGNENNATGLGTAIVGGNSNLVTDDYGFIGGGIDNQAGDNAGTEGDHIYATVGGGKLNKATAVGSAVGGGYNNTASGYYAVVSGGTDNIASGARSSVTGGLENSATWYGAVVVGGDQNTSSGYRSAVVAGSKNSASGSGAVVLGGYQNVASGSYSVAAGLRAQANFSGCFVFADGSGTPTTVNPGAANRFVVRSLGGAYFWTNWSGTQLSGVYTSAGSGSWAAACDRNLKENFVDVNGEEVLEKVVSMPVQLFNYKGADASNRHMGVMAQDFSGAFGLGIDPLSITTQDADGVAMAAIQGLNTKLERELAAKNDVIAAMQAELAAMREQIQELAQR